ncbi:Ig-like domain-containing protein [Microtetraspora malaysiensis]|uniref:Ig-like domain-containing protein n=1 Tax=Microtetraspora malaysiensis TaxID=161358 RepID=A0ABW6T2V8_9ACTN
MVETSPTTGAIDVATDTAVTVTFSEPVTGGHITVNNPAGETVSGNTSGILENRIMAFTPADPMSAGTVYTVHVTDAHDASGNVMDAYSWSFTTTTQSPTAEPINANPSFESGLDPWYAGWSGDEITQSTEQAHEGTASAKLTVNDCCTAIAQDLDVQPGTYRLTGWVRPNQDSEAFFGVDWYNASWEYIGGSDAYNNISAGQWQPLESFVATVPTGAAKAVLWAEADSATNAPNYTVYFDDLRMVPESATGNLQSRASTSGGKTPKLIKRLREKIAARKEQANTKVVPLAEPSGPQGLFERRTTQWCEDNAISVGPASGASLFRPYDWCSSKWVAYSLFHRSRNDSIPMWDGTFQYSVSTVAQAHVGNSNGSVSLDSPYRRPRDIDVWMRISRPFVLGFKNGTSTDGFQMKVTLKAAAEPGAKPSACEIIEGNDRNDRWDTAAYWKANPEVRFRVYSDPNGTLGAPEYASTCTLSPYVSTYSSTSALGTLLYRGSQLDTTPAFPLIRNIDMKPHPIYLGCDTSVSLTTYKGGCRFLDHLPIYVMDVADPEVKEVATHVWTAFNSPGATDPRIPRKVVPGNANAPLGTDGAKPLTRAAFGNDERSFFAPYCDDLRKKSGKYSGWHCDEYPFNSTNQNPKNAKGMYSLKLIPEADNTSAGDDLWRFQERYRLLEGDPFWVSIKGSPPWF